MKKTKRILCILVCLCLALSYIGITAFTAEGDTCICGGIYINGFCMFTDCENYYQPASANESGIYEIGNAGQLYWFAELVNSGENEYPAADNGEVYNAVLTADIVVNTAVLDENGDLVSDTTGLRQWMPIGYYGSGSEYLRYSGIFDGCGHTISGLYYYGEHDRYVGLFGYLDSNGTVQNVGLVDSYISAKNNVGGIAGYAISGSRIINCYNTAPVIGSTGSMSYIGGIVGWSVGANIEGCYNAGAVSGSSNIGGIAGGAWNTAAITNCYNTGTVNADDSVGGIVGYMAYDSVVSNCYNVGAVAAEDYCAGSIAGNLSSGAVSNCFYLTGTATVVDAVEQYGIGSTGRTAGSFTADTQGVAASKTAAQFAGGEVAYTMNGSTGTGEDLVWYQNIDAKDTTPDAAPVLDDTHGVVYYGYPDCSTNMGYTNFKPVEGETGPHKDADGDYICDICGTEIEKPVEPSEPDESDPTDPDGTNPTQPSEPEPSKPQVPECEKDETCVLAQFDDIIIADWYHDGVHFCVEEGIMNGMGDGVFAPNEATTRAQLVMMLYRLEGEPSIEGMSEPFTDVAETDWFYEPIVWAYNTKVVNGMSETTFEPNTNVSREQVATILYRYLDTPAGTGDLSGYPDVDKVQDYAKDALIWAVGEGLINGVKQADGTSLLDPAGNATRAQIATILMRYLTA